MSPIFSHVHRHELPLEELVHLHFHQDLIPQTRAVRPVVGERFLGTAPQGFERTCGQRRAEIGERRILLLLEEHIEIPQP